MWALIWRSQKCQDHSQLSCEEGRKGGGRERKGSNPHLHHLQLSSGCPLPLGLEGNCPVTGVLASPTPIPAPCSGVSEGSVQQSLELRPGEYRVLLCVDVGETKG